MKMLDLKQEVIKMEFKQALLQKMKVLKKGETDLTLDDLIVMLEQEIMLEPCSYNDKQRIKRCINYAKKVKKTLRPILGYTSNDIEGFQIYTDSYFLVKLDTKDTLNIPNYTEAYPKGTYPIVRTILNHQYSFGVKVQVNDIRNAIKIKKDICIIDDNERRLLFNCEKLKLLLDFLNYQDDEIVLEYSDYQRYDSTEYVISIVKVTKPDSESIGIICPIRNYNGEMMVVKGVRV